MANHKIEQGKMQSDANGGVTQYRYDNSGNRVQLTDASFNTTRWQYDAQGQVLSETDPNRLSIVNEFDLVGNIAAVTDRRGYRTQFVRDNLDNVLREQWLQPGKSKGNQSTIHPIDGNASGR